MRGSLSTHPTSPPPPVGPGLRRASPVPTAGWSHPVSTSLSSTCEMQGQFEWLGQPRGHSRGPGERNPAPKAPTRPSLGRPSPLARPSPAALCPRQPHPPPEDTCFSGGLLGREDLPDTRFLLSPHLR